MFKYNVLFLDRDDLSLSIEITSYAILTLLKSKDLEHKQMALKAVKWLTKQQNSKGGFVSAQVSSFCCN
jgi:prenyltransferase beta subunit